MTERGPTTWTGKSLAVLTLATIALLVVVPLLDQLVPALRTAAHPIDLLRDQLHDPALQTAFVRTLAVALLACGLASLLAIPTAILIVRGTTRPGWLVTLFGIMPLAIPPVFTASALGEILASLPSAWPAGLPGHAVFDTPESHLAAVYALHYFPLIVFGLAISLAGIDRDLEESVRNLGAWRWTVWRRVVLPLATPGYVLGVAVMALRILEDAATPWLLGIDGMLATRFMQGLLGIGSAGETLWAGALLLTGMSLMVVLLGWQALQPAIGAFRAIPRPRAVRWRTGPLMSLAAQLVTLAALIVVLLPCAAIVHSALSQAVPVPGDAWHALMQSVPDDTWPSLAKTIVFALFAGLLMIIAALPLGRMAVDPGGWVRTARSATTLLLAIPAVVLAGAYLHTDRIVAADAPPGHIAWLLLAVVVVVKLLPLAQYLMASRMRQLPPALFEATQTLGGGLHWTAGLAFGAVSGTVMTVFLLAVAATMTEVSVALTLLRQPDTTIAALVFELARSDQAWAAVALTTAGLCIGTLTLAVWFWRRKYRPAAPSRVPYRQPLSES